MSVSSSRNGYSLSKSNWWLTGGTPLKKVALPMTVSWPIVTAGNVTVHVKLVSWGGGGSYEVSSHPDRHKQGIHHTKYAIL